ncbi:hypothetical protein GCM10023221_31300 [Luteimicrobium xylanilyticum]|uniref:Uncharacterized protein n=1 Tax=Luteimicrobium xylanilyticum TaxID=1133546 RepID=A0A5P9Q5E2_9MICO|nr:hypothetical protein [Luteimicrobium xylanilyticum]QFU96581.1 hypothetical protein KDY119_00065 [Luteimicrobium xylanilyticum]
MTSERQRAETRFREPDVETVRALVDDLLTSSGDPARAATASWVRTGSSSLVVLGEHTAVRVARDAHAAPELLRAQSVVDALPPSRSRCRARWGWPRCTTA